MQKFFQIANKSAYQLVIAGTVLAALGILGVGGHVSSSTVYSATMVITGGGALLAGIVLGSPQDNSNLFPHLVLSLMLIAMVVTMALENVFTSSMVDGFFAVVVGSGGTGIGVGAGVVSTNAIVDNNQPPGAHSVTAFEGTKE